MYHPYFKQLIHTREAKQNTQPFQLQPFGDKSIHYLQHSNNYINIAVGAIRSSKTITTIIRFLSFIGHSPHTVFAVAGVTMGALKRNVVTPLLQILDLLHVDYEYHKFDGEIILQNPHKVLTLFGLDKLGSDEKIKGFTCAGSLLDEVTIMNQEAVYMLISRNSLSGAKIFMTCNPGNPNNFINEDYVSNKELHDNGTVLVENFTLEDNPSLDPEYIQYLKNLYPPDSVFYKRNILGEWVSGRGIIFDSFTDDNIFTGEVDLEGYDYLEISSDYGTSTTTCYTLVGVKCHSDYNQFDVISEMGYDATKEVGSQTDVERVDDIVQLQDKYNLGEDNVFYCSHDAGSLMAALLKDDRVRMSVESFMPDTLECINVMSSLFFKNHLRVHESCVETIKQIKGYEWDSKASLRGEDKPVKRDDHYVDSMRGVIMNHLFDMESELLGGLVYL